MKIYFPIKKTNIMPFGYPYLFNKKTKYSNIKKENRLVIVSQSDFTDQLSKFAIKTSKLFSTDIKVEYKPHPYEYVGSEPKYFQELRSAGVTISDKDSDIYEIFARSRWQVGIFSTELSNTSFKATIPSLSELICFELKLPVDEKFELPKFCKHPVLTNNAQVVTPTKRFLRLKIDMQCS